MADTFGVKLETLRPTQMTVGFREVEIKRQEWRKATKKERTQLLRSHIIPAVLGPKKRPFIVDHHHFARALLEEGAPLVGVYVLTDLSNLPKDEFWTFLDNSDWCHAYDRHGRRCELNDIPAKLLSLEDDPYRSLVGELIRAGGCAKTNQPFFEFLWADFFRRRIAKDLIDADFASALVAAVALAKSGDARSLPGSCAAP